MKIYGLAPLLGFLVGSHFLLDFVTVVIVPQNCFAPHFQVFLGGLLPSPAQTLQLPLIVIELMVQLPEQVYTRLLNGF